MRLIARQFLICLVILFFIGGLYAKEVDYPKPARCESDKDCLQGKAKCLRRECHCTDYHDVGDGKNNCDKWRECIIDICRFASSKRYRNSHCLAHPQSGTKTKTCKCNSGYFGRVHSKCVSAAKTKGRYPCLTRKNCPTYAHCYKGWCICPYELTGNGEKCKPHPPKKCSSDKRCRAEQGRCIDGVCRCVGMYAGNGIYCREASPCPGNVECGSGGICMVDSELYPKTPLCVCNPGAKKTKDGKCVECFSNKDCKKTYSICVKGKCSCKEELLLGNKSCEPAPLHPCADDNECHSRAKCQEGKCICQGKTTGNGKYCRDSLPCTKDCGGGGTCLKEPLMPKHSSVCRCDKGFSKTKDGKCVECSSNTDCNYATCTNGVCKCAPGQIKEGKTCKRAPAHPCKKNDDCHEKAECHRGKCHCVGKTTGNGEYCRDPLPCPKEHVEKCKAGGSNVISCVVDPLFPDQPECKCHVDFKTSEAGICVAMTECDKNGLDCPTGKVCKTDKGNHWCACKDGYEEILLGARNRTCQDIDECKQGPCSGVENSVCANVEGSYYCECKEGFRKSADESTCEAGANQICQEGVCKCSPGFAKNGDGECEDVDECSQDETLCGDNEECLNDQGKYSCVCQSGYKKKNKVCVKKDECNCKRLEVCLKGKCKCKQGYKKSTKGYCFPRRRWSLQAGVGLSLHVSGFPSIFVLGVLGRLAFTE